MTAENQEGEESRKMDLTYADDLLPTIRRSTAQVHRDGGHRRRARPTCARCRWDAEMATRLTPTDRRRFYWLDQAAHMDERARVLREEASELSLRDNLDGTHLYGVFTHMMRENADKYNELAAMGRTEAEILGLEVLDP